MENKTEFREELDNRLSKTWETIFKIWRNKKVQVALDVFRILTFILLVYIIFTLISEIEIVKSLNQDPCKICMNKTGCDCWCGEILEIKQDEDTKILNYTDLIPKLNYTPPDG